MVLAMPVFHPALPGHMLLRPGFALDAPALKRMVELRIFLIWIRYPALDDLVRFIDPEVTTEHEQLCSLIGRTMDKLSDPIHAHFDYKVFAEAIRSMLGKLARANSSTLLITDLAGSESRLALHSGATCFLSLLMGLKLQEYIVTQRTKLTPQAARCIENLGVAAMLHDVGTLRLSDFARAAYKRTADESTPEYMHHTRIGYEMMRGKVEPTAAATVLHHHQNYNGSGWPAVHVDAGMSLPPPGGRPQGLIGEQIHIFARILSVADRYDAMRNPPIGNYSEQARVPSLRVLRDLLVLSRQRIIDPIAFKGLLNVVPAFLPGTLVQLNNGQTAVVTDFDPLRPCRPTVRIFTCGMRFSTDDQDDALGPPITLVSRRELCIAESEGQNVLSDQFEAIDPTEFDLRVLRLPKTKRSAAA